MSTGVQVTSQEWRTADNLKKGGTLSTEATIIFVTTRIILFSDMAEGMFTR
jgi:hypothetical protein